MQRALSLYREQKQNAWNARVQTQNHDEKATWSIFKANSQIAFLFAGQVVGSSVSLYASEPLCWVSSGFIETLSLRDRAKGSPCLSWIWVQALTLGRLHMHWIWKGKVTHQSLQLYLSTLKIIAHRLTFQPKIATLLATAVCLHWMEGKVNNQLICIISFFKNVDFTSVKKMFLVQLYLFYVFFSSTISSTDIL